MFHVKHKQRVMNDILIYLVFKGGVSKYLEIKFCKKLFPRKYLYI